MSATRAHLEHGGDPMSATRQQALEQFGLTDVRQTLLRYQPASNWVSLARDPTERMTIGFGFDVGRPEAPEMLTQVGLDPAAVRSGRTPMSDAQMHELFDLVLLAAVRSAGQRVPGFAAMDSEQQAALLELIMWLGPDETETVFREFEYLSLPPTQEIPEPSPWFDRCDEVTPHRASSRAWAGAISRTVKQARQRLQSVGRRRSRSRFAITFESFGILGELASDDRNLLHAAQSMLPPDWRERDGRPSVWFGVWTDGSITVNGALRGLDAPGRPLVAEAWWHRSPPSGDQRSWVHVRARRCRRRRRLRDRHPGPFVHRQIDPSRRARPPRRDVRLR